MLKVIVASFSVFVLIYGSPTPKIEYATQFESPWLALIEIGDHRCGGSLVEDKFIITAAHCFERFDLKNDTKTLKIKLGEWKTDTDPDCDYETSGESCDNVAEISVDQIILHESYDENKIDKYQYDIAIIKLSWEPRKSDIISNIELPDKVRCNDPLTGEMWIVTGFGRELNNQFTKTKKKVVMEVISSQKCKDMIDSKQKSLIRDNNICGRSNDTLTCSGDSGSGAVRVQNGVTYLEGIVSFGAKDCGPKIYPTIFLKVSCYREWIDEKISKFINGGKRTSKVLKDESTTEAIKETTTEFIFEQDD